MVKLNKSVMKHVKTPNNDIVAGDLTPTLKSKIKKVLPSKLANATLLSRGKHSKRFVATCIVIGVIVGVLGYLGYVNLVRDDSSNQSTLSVLDEETIKRSAPLLDGSDQQKLKSEVDKINKISNFEKDTNALYIVTTYYTFESDIENARKSLAMLEKTYPDMKPANEIVAKAGELALVRERINVFEAQLNQNRANFSGFGPVAP